MFIYGTFQKVNNKGADQTEGNNTGADQPAHPRRLISAFVIRFLESIISKLATSEISIFLLVSVAEETGLNLTLSETSTTGFLVTKAHIMSNKHPF